MIPKSWKRIKTRPLAYGEVTGHMHAVCPSDLDAVEMYEHEDGMSFIVTGDSIRIVHGKDPSNLREVQPGEDRHDVLHVMRDKPQQQRQGDVLVTPIPGLKGGYDVRIQIEEGPDEAIRQVAD